jgi:hypothetical protein
MDRQSIVNTVGAALLVWGTWVSTTTVLAYNKSEKAEWTNELQDKTLSSLTNSINRIRYQGDNEH